MLACTTGTVVGNQEVSAPREEKNPWQSWWNGSKLLGGEGWFVPEFRKTLADYGLKIDSSYQGAFFGVVDSQKGSRGFWNQQLNLSG